MSDETIIEYHRRAAGDEMLRQWLADYLAAHPEHTTAVLARADYIGIARRMATRPISVLCSPNTTPTSFVKHLAHLVGAEVRQQAHLTEEEIAAHLWRSPKPLFIDQANYLDEKSLGTLCFLWERQHLPM